MNQHHIYNMKRIDIIVKTILILAVIGGHAYGQKIDGAYVKALYAKYPTVKSNFCKACKLWVNPYYKSIADTQQHRPLIEYELYTKANAAISDKIKIPRGAPKKGAIVKPGAMPYQSAFSAWNSVTGQPNEDAVYVAANKIVKPLKDEIAKGHMQAWILNSFAIDAVILSDTYTFNAAPEDQSQNVGTEIFTEEHTRNLLKTMDVQVWGGTFGNQDTFTDGKIKDVYPSYYWKVIKYGTTTECWLMPNNKTQTMAMIKSTIISYASLVKELGFDPCKILK